MPQSIKHLRINNLQSKKTDSIVINFERPTRTWESTRCMTGSRHGDQMDWQREKMHKVVPLKPFTDINQVWWQGDIAHWIGRCYSHNQSSLH